MKRVNENRNRGKAILLTIIAVFFIGFVLFPLSMKMFDGAKFGNVALIPIEGEITSNGGGGLGSQTLSSKTTVNFIEQAEKNPQIEVIYLEINSPGGSPVATDEIVNAIKKTKKPTVALIREVGASGGYWVGSATDYIITNRMSITGSIGVKSSWLEFSGLMDKYGVGYEQVNAGEFKELASPYKQLQNDERVLLERVVNKIHDYFISGVAENRGLSEEQVRKLATGEIFLGVEALDLGLVDQLGDQDTVEEYIKETYGLEKVDFVTYQREISFFELLAGLSTNFAFNIGEGIGSILLNSNSHSQSSLLMI
ncbi:MAG: signal peptide peptidase SppA [Candidatus Woesearchaeota archaeon]|nr:signal peptide peptidase SppA [Nanoarchaeota archaeon]MBU1622228.1 signal peptide peptidase SppA [Nanoarchaeota archaeon]MBU1974751.1 signal peptide peptidase SppA [Nanoarchaeota archaeon]